VTHALVRDGAVIVLAEDARVAGPDGAEIAPEALAVLSRAEKLALWVFWQGERYAGLWEVEREPGTAWDYHLQGDRVAGRAVPPAVPVDVAALARVLLSRPEGPVDLTTDADRLAAVAGKLRFEEGDLAVEDGVTWRCHQELAYVDPTHRPSLLPAHFSAQPPEGEGDLTWEQRYPPNLYGADYVGRVFQYDGRRYELTAPDTTAHPPPVRPDIWDDLGPIP
jgi:hypothetical protein